jgi:glycosyltransferase involved in cell wall biosynthesis
VLFVSTFASRGGPVHRPLVSCVVSVFNGERYLREALDSILNQTWRPLDVIVADDGSIDGSRAIATSYGAPVRLVTQSTAGPSATRNLGVGAARGEFIAFLDADDLWHPEKLTRQMAQFAARPQIDLCITYVQMFWSDQLAAEAEHYRHHPRRAPVQGYATTSLLARRSAFERSGPFDSTLWFADAVDWFIRAREKGLDLHVLNEVLTYHRMHDRNLTRRRSDASRNEFLGVVKAAVDRRRSERLQP